MSNNRNSCAEIIQIIAVIYGIIAAIAAIAIGLTIESLAYFVVILIAGFVQSVFIYGFGEIISLLSNIDYKIGVNIKSQNEYQKPQSVQIKNSKKTKPEQVTVSAESYVHNTNVNPDEKVVHFSSRTVEEITCPICQREQMSNRDVCSRCGCKFIYDDENDGD